MEPQNHYSKTPLRPTKEQVERWVVQALEEDLGAGDITTQAIVDPHCEARARVTAREPSVLCGLDLVKAVFLKLDEHCRFDDFGFQDGARVNAGSDVMEIRGSCSALLSGERTALNILQRLSGIATLTRLYVERAHPVKVLDTRKTTPGIRVFEKYAVACGGGLNHRFGLFDAILIKDNHLKIAGSVTEALRRVRNQFASRPIEVETTTLQQVEEALQNRADIILLDNMSQDEIEEAVRLIQGRAKIEVSGNITLERLETLRSTGIDFVSVGALTHSARAVDFSMNLCFA